MAQKIIDRGTKDNPKTGDSLYDGAGKINDNFTELYNASGGLTSVGYNDLETDLKGVSTITEVIDWGAGITLKYAATNGANVVFTESNAVGSGESKTITIEITGTPNSITFPARFKKAVNTSEDYDGTYRNIYVLEDNSTNVMYANTLFNV